MRWRGGRVARKKKKKTGWIHSSGWESSPICRPFDFHIHWLYGTCCVYPAQHSHAPFRQPLSLSPAAAGSFFIFCDPVSWKYNLCCSGSSGAIAHPRLKTAGAISLAVKRSRKTKTKKIILDIYLLVVFTAASVYKKRGEFGIMYEEKIQSRYGTKWMAFDLAAHHKILAETDLMAVWY